MKLIEWLKRLFKKRKPAPVKRKVDMLKVEEPTQSKQRETEDIDEQLSAIRARLEEQKREALDLARGSREIGRQLGKEIKREAIRRKNVERRRSTLGHGLKSRHFKPRPAHEKRLWKLDEKAEND